MKRSKFEGRSGILMWKWILEYPDQLWNHVEMRECRQHSTFTCTSARKTRFRDASSQQQRRRRCGGHDGDGDLRPIQHECCEIESDWQSRPLHKHSRSTYFKAIQRGRRIDRYWPDHHCTEVAGTQERHQRNDGIAEVTCHFQGQVHHYCEHRLGDRCNLRGIRVPKRTRWRPQRIHSEAYRQVR